MGADMTDHDALARELIALFWAGNASPETLFPATMDAFNKLADIALAHIKAARAKGYEAGLKAGFYEGVKAAHENIGLPQDPPA
jgi:hypothetical protein